MDLERALRELYEEKRHLDKAIAVLEKQERAGVHEVKTRRRGRRTMTAEERRAVSDRMMLYWAERKAATA